MALVQWRVRSKRAYQPANFNANEADTAAIRVNVGDVVGAAFCRIRAAYDGTTPTLALGDGSDADGFMTTTNTGATATGIKLGTGAYTDDTPGKLYTAADYVSVEYNIGATDSTQIGRCDFWIWVAKANPY